MDKYTPGATVKVNMSGDIYCMADCRDFLCAKCVVVKKTKSGLIMVALNSDMKRTYSFPQRNIDLDMDNNENI